MKRSYWLALLGILLATCVIGVVGIALIARSVANPFASTVVHLKASNVPSETVAEGWTIFKPPSFNWEQVSGSGTGPNDKYIGESLLITMDHLGRLWFTRRGGGLMMYDGTTWHDWRHLREDTTTLNVTAIDNDVYTFFPEDREGPVSHLDMTTDKWDMPWSTVREPVEARALASDTNRNLYIVEGEQIRIVHADFFELRSSPCQSVSKLEVFPDGDLWMRSMISSEICSKDEEGWHRHIATPDTFRYVNAIQQDSQGRIWIANSQDLMLRNTDGEWYRLSGGFLDTDSVISDIAIDLQDRLWFVMGNTLFVYNGDTFVTFSSSIIDERVWWSGYEDHGHAMLFDQAGRLWMANYEKVVRFDGTVDLPSFNIDAFIQQAEPLDVFTQDVW